jgi:hypothetical protein
MVVTVWSINSQASCPTRFLFRTHKSMQRLREDF